MILTEEGYVTLSGTTPTYYYYLKDHQGNNRVVINQGGAVQQVNHYYPFGGVFGEGLQSSGQPYKYNGKELDTKIGLNMYDYGARHYDAALGRWFAVDPLAEKYYGISSYVYCANNPIKFIDPDGSVICLANNYAGGMENIARIAATSLGNHVMSHLIGRKEVYTLKSVFLTRSSEYDSNANIVKYVGNPWYSELPKDGGANTSMTAMGHELYHAYDHSNYVFNSSNASYSFNIVEPHAVSFANYLRSAYSLSPLRSHYTSGGQQIGGNFYQFEANEKISDFTAMGNNADKTSYGFRYSKTTTIVESYKKVFFGMKVPDKTSKKTTTHYLTISRDKKNNVSYRIYDDEEEYKRATSGW